VRLAVTGPRPVAAAGEILERWSGRAITYEDPRYGPGDLVPGPATGLVPRSGSISIDYEANDDVERVSQRVLDAHARAGGAGRFGVQAAAGRFDIAPLERANGDSGTQMAGAPIMGTPVSLAPGERDGVRLVGDLAAAISAERGVRVTPGILPTNLLVQTTGVVRAERTPARDLVTQSFMALRPPISWQLFFDPESAGFVLNLHQVRS
jgi:hypothetical protein